MCKELCNKRLGTLAIVMQGTSLGDILQKFVQSLHGLLGESVESSLDSLRVYAVLDFWIFEGNLKTSDEKKGGERLANCERTVCASCVRNLREVPREKNSSGCFCFVPVLSLLVVVSEDLYVSKSFASHREKSADCLAFSLLSFFLLLFWPELNRDKEKYPSLPLASSNFTRTLQTPFYNRHT